jgi:hypothetical protein
MSLQIAGHEVNDPMAIWSEYVHLHGKTIQRYDLIGPGNPDVLTEDEVWRTRIVVSRVTKQERSALPHIWMESRAASLPSEASIVDADPLKRQGLYDDAQAVVAAFIGRPGIGYTKAYKVLHVKRPHLFPILDSKLRKLYEEQEKACRAKHRDLLPDDGRNFWGVIRLDVLRNLPELNQYRRLLSKEPDLLGSLSSLSDLRLLDILSWRLAQLEGF